MSECRIIEIGRVVRMLRALRQGELIMVFPPGEIAEAKEIGAAGHAVAVIPKDLWIASQTAGLATVWSSPTAGIS